MSITNIGQRLVWTVFRQMSTNITNHPVPPLWQKLTTEIYKRAPTIVVTCGITAIVSGTGYVVKTVDDHIKRLDSRIDKLDSRIETVQTEARADMRALGVKIDNLTRIVLESLNKR